MDENDLEDYGIKIYIHPPNVPRTRPGDYSILLPTCQGTVWKVTNENNSLSLPPNYVAAPPGGYRANISGGTLIIRGKSVQANNVFHKRSDHIRDATTRASDATTTLHQFMPQPIYPASTDTEGRIVLAIQAINYGQIQSLRHAAKTYNVPYITLNEWFNGKPARRDCVPHNWKLTCSEEMVIIDYILDLDSRGYPPRVCAVGEMANLLLVERGGTPIGQCWTSNFINRRPEIKSMFNRKHDHKRLLCQDPELIGGWFTRVRNVIAKYGIAE